MQNPQFLLFPGFLPKALTFSYDDGVWEDIRLVEILRKNGLIGTFNINSELFGTGTKRMPLEKVKSLYGNDMEIAVHGAAHLSLKRLTPSFAMREVLADRENLEKEFGKIVRGMAFSFGSYNEKTIEIIKSAGIAYARTTYDSDSFDIPDNWLTLHPTCHHNSKNLERLVNDFLAPVKLNQNSRPKLFYLWGHSYEFADDNNWELIENFCEIMGKQKDVWFATNIDIYNYVEAFYRLVFSADHTFVENPTSTDVYLKINGKQIIAKAGELTDL